jgi:formiminotetrahydrofolate cyclodeaminase
MSVGVGDVAAILGISAGIITITVALKDLKERNKRKDFQKLGKLLFLMINLIIILFG